MESRREEGTIKNAREKQQSMVNILAVSVKKLQDLTLKCVGSTNFSGYVHVCAKEKQLAKYVEVGD